MSLFKRLSLLTTTVVTLQFSTLTMAHDIDNRTPVLNAFDPKYEQQSRYKDSEPLHCDGAICEGQVTNECLVDEVRYKNRTFHEIYKNFWHWRRVLVAQIELLAGDVNALSERMQTQGDTNPAVFMNYDPFRTGADPYNPELPALYNATYVPQGVPAFAFDGLEIRYDYLWLSHNQNFGRNALLQYKSCSAMTSNELLQAPECAAGAERALVGGDSYLAPLPLKGEGALVYYDRIPSHPLMDACILMKENRLTREQMFEYAMAHEIAGKVHAETVLKRRYYIALALQKFRAR